MRRLHDLELRHLIALDAVASEGTFGRAALRLGYTQSAVSQQIAALERLLGDSVFDRPGGPRPVELTPLGKVVLGHARDVITRVNAAGEAVERFLAGETGRIDIGTFQSVSTVLLPPIVARLRDEYPDLDIRLFEDEHKEEGTRRVLAGDLDLTFCCYSPPPELTQRVLLEDPYLLVTKRGDAVPGPFPAAALDGSPLVGYPPSLCQQDIEDGLRAVGAVPTFVFRTLDNGAQVAMVRAGMGWALMPMLAVDVNDPTIDVHTLSPAIPPREISVAWRGDRTCSPIALRLIDIAADVATDLARLPATA